MMVDVSGSQVDLGSPRILEILGGEVPSVEPFIPYCESEMYGASSLIAERLGLRHVPDSYSSWTHGWNAPSEIVGAYQLDGSLASSEHHKYHLVHRHDQYEFLTNLNVKNVKTVGAPFIYAKLERREPIGRSLLVMPVHGLTGIKTDYNFDQYFHCIKEVASDFDVTCWCLPRMGKEKEVFIKKLVLNGMEWILGADPSDRNSLRRTAYMLNRFECVTANARGSHLAYACSAGCKVSLYGDLFERSPYDFRDYKPLKNRPEFIKLAVRSTSKGYIEDHFPWFFVDHPLQATDMQDWGDEQLGLSHMCDPNHLSAYLGWTFQDKMIRGPKRQIKKIIAGAARFASPGIRKIMGVENRTESLISNISNRLKEGCNKNDK